MGVGPRIDAHLMRAVADLQQRAAGRGRSGRRVAGVLSRVAMSADGAPRTRERSLAPLRWVAEEDLRYEPHANTLHRAACDRVRDREASVLIAVGSSLHLVWAPKMCRCGPDVTLALGSEKT